MFCLATECGVMLFIHLFAGRLDDMSDYVEGIEICTNYVALFLCELLDPVHTCLSSMVLFVSVGFLVERYDVPHWALIL